VPLLDPVDGLPLHTGTLGEPLLGEVGVEAGGSDLVADGPAAGKDPVGLWGG